VDALSAAQLEELDRCYRNFFDRNNQQPGVCAPSSARIPRDNPLCD
jgi:hypothetical protein